MNVISNRFSEWLNPQIIGGRDFSVDSLTIGYAKSHTKNLGKINFWKGIIFKVEYIPSQFICILGSCGRLVEKYAFPVVCFSWHFSMLFSIANSRRFHWNISSINYLGFQPCTDLFNIGCIANRPLGGEPNLFAMLFENLMPIPNTMPEIKNLPPSAQWLWFFTY